MINGVSCSMQELNDGYEGVVQNFVTREVLARKTFRYPKEAMEWAHEEKVKFTGRPCCKDFYCVEHQEEDARNGGQ